MAHQWDKKPDRDAEYVVTCLLCDVTVEHTVEYGRYDRWVNYHTFPGRSRQRGLAPKCTGRIGGHPVESVQTIERPISVQSPRRQAMSSEYDRLLEVELLFYQLVEELLPREKYGYWAFKWDHAKRRFGQCNYTRRTISLSKPWALERPIEETRVVIIHEIAHARTPGAKHGPRWVAEARRLGIPGDRCDSTDAEITAKYEAVCGRCGNKAQRHKMTKHMKIGNYACTPCCNRYNGGRWSKEFILEFKQMY